MKELHLLLVEDNPGDVILTREAFCGNGLNTKIIAVADGEEAIDFLFRRDKYADAPKPDIILMDIHLPKLNGLETLNIIKTTASLAVIPVIMLTSSSANTDIMEAYRAYAESYIVKPITLRKFITAATEIQNSWFEGIHAAQGRALA